MPEAQDIGFIPDVLREIVRHKRGEVERLQREHPGSKTGSRFPRREIWPAPFGVREK